MDSILMAVLFVSIVVSFFGAFRGDTKVAAGGVVVMTLAVVMLLCNSAPIR